MTFHYSYHEARIAAAFTESESYVDHGLGSDGDHSG